MKQSFLLILSMLLLSVGAYADVFVVKDYKQDTKNLAAIVHSRKDNNDETCGLILVRTGIINLGIVTGGGTGVAGSVDFKDGYYWVYLSPGTRRISFYKEGFERLNYDLPEPVKSEATYILTLRSRSTGNSTTGNTMGFVVIKSNPPGADVYINDTAVGAQTPFQNPYHEGYYRFKLKKPFYDDYSGSFEITRGKTTRENITLVPDFGGLQLRFTPSKRVSVNIDGYISTQDSPYSIVKLKPGTHTLVLKKVTYDEYRQNFTIQKGQTTTLNINMVPNFGGFTVRTTPEINAKVNIDGVDYDGKTPLTIAKLAPGSHTVNLSKEMYLPWQGSFTITKGKNTLLSITMKPTFGTVEISAHEGDKIFIDNRQEGTGSYSGRLLKGDHVIRVEHENYYSQSRQIAVHPGKNLKERFTLLPKTGTLSVMTNPIGADIMLDNKPMGQTPRFIDSLMVGDYTVKLQKQGYASVEKHVEITENQTTSIKETLANGMNVQITSQPEGSVLYLDGNNKGTTPLKLAVNFGEHTIRLVNGKYTIKKNILFSEKSPLRLNFKMNPVVNYTETAHNLNLEMVFVKGGTFEMGSNNGDDYEKPIHEVRVDDFYIGKYEVTQKQWKAIMWNAILGNNPSYFKGDDLPVECVTWDYVQEFLKKLNRITGKHYRLPTEAEWEYAARGGNQSLGYQYSGSNNLDEVAWYWKNSGNKLLSGDWSRDKIESNKTHTVGTKTPNELGIYDMSGNVWEWCNDWYGKEYYKNSPGTNPQGPSSGYYRVIRGGNWFMNAVNCRVANRSYYVPDDGYYYIGFRLVLSVP